MSEIKGVKVAGKVYSLNDEIVRAALEDLKEQLGDGSFVVSFAGCLVYKASKSLSGWVWVDGILIV